MTIEIWIFHDFPIKNGGSFHCYLAVHQRVNMLKQHIPYWGCQNLGVRYHSQTHVLSRYFQQPSAGNPLVEQSYDPFVAGKNRWFSSRWSKLLDLLGLSQLDPFFSKSPCLMIHPFQSIPAIVKHCQGSIPPITLHIFHRNGRQFLCTAPQLLRHRRRRTTRWTGGNSTLSSWQHEVVHVPHRKPA